VSAAVSLPDIPSLSTVVVSVSLDTQIEQTEAARILQDPPKDGTRLRIYLDGSRRVTEDNEDNNEAFFDRAALPKLAGTVALPDIAFTMVFVPPGSDRLVIGFANEGKAEAPIWEWQVRWLDAKDQPVGETYRGMHPGLKPTWRYGVGSDSQDLTGKPRSLPEFLKQIPNGATRIEITIDPENKIAESDEQKNVQHFEIANFPSSLRAQKSAPELAVTLSVKVLPSPTASAASSSANAGLLLAFVALLSGGYLIHGHTGMRKSASGFFAVFPMLFASADSSYMFLRKCGPEDCAGSHFARHIGLKRLARASAVATAFAGAVKAVLVVGLVLIGPSAVDVAAGEVVVYPGDRLEDTMTVKNTGKIRAQEIVFSLGCPSGSAQEAATLQSGKKVSTDPAKGVSVPDLDPQGINRLTLTCAVQSEATQFGALEFIGSARASGTSAVFKSNAVRLPVAARLKPKPEAIQEKSDLIVEGVGFLPLVDIIEKDRAPFEAMFTAIVSNQGKKDSGSLRARVRVDNGGNGTWEAVSPSLVSVPSLAAGGQTLIKLPLQWVAAVGTYTFEICADPGKNIDESDETNNCATDRFTLKVGEEPYQEEEIIQE